GVIVKRAGRDGGPQRLLILVSLRAHLTSLQVPFDLQIPDQIQFIVSASAPNYKRRPDAARRPAQNGRVDLVPARADLSIYVSPLVIRLPSPRFYSRENIPAMRGNIQLMRAVSCR